MPTWTKHPSFFALAFLGVVVAGVALLMNKESDTVTADTQPLAPCPGDPGISWGGVGQDQPPGPDVLPVANTTPDITLRWWHIPYANQDNQAPVADSLSINGITVGPGLVPTYLSCPADGRDVALADVATTDVRIPLDTLPLPPGTTVNEGWQSTAVTCRGEGWSSFTSLLVESDMEHSRLGGFIDIHRAHASRGTAPVAIPEYRWSGVEIAGNPAAVARPIITDVGFGESAILIFKDGVLTKIQAFGIPLGELIAVAEGLYR